jgi:TonB family protein
VRGRASVVGLGCIAVMAACAIAPSPLPPPPQKVIEPADVSTTYIRTWTRHHERGQHAIIEVCLAPDGVITGTRVVESSTDHGFDAAALDWARQARYRPRLENGRPVRGCIDVRVEINPNPDMGPSRSADDALG